MVRLIRRVDPAEEMFESLLKSYSTFFFIDIGVSSSETPAPWAYCRAFSIFSNLRVSDNAQDD